MRDELTHNFFLLISQLSVLFTDFHPYIRPSRYHSDLTLHYFSYLRVSSRFEEPRI